MSKPEALDYEEPAPRTLTEAVSRILYSFGEQGATLEDIANIIARNLPQYSPSSASPAVSVLIGMGYARQTRHFGTRRIYHVRSFDQSNPLDTKTLSDYNARRKNSRPPRSENAPQLPAARADATIAQIMIAIGDKDTVVLTMVQARAIYNQLHQLFGGGAR